MMKKFKQTEKKQILYSEIYIHKGWSMWTFVDLVAQHEK